MSFRVMVVEDEPVVAVGVRSMIQESGHEVVGVARNSEEALAMGKEFRPDVAVMDIKLPGANGIEITRKLVEECDLAVIILTAYSNQEFIEGAAAAGAFTYLLKPDTQEALCANLEVAVARSMAFAEVRKEADDVKAALENRKLAERAKHILMDRLSLSEADAFNHLRQKCRNQNKTIRQTAEEILAAEDMFMATVDKDSPKKCRPGTDK